MDVIETWLRNIAYSHSASEQTRKSYTIALQKFCNFIQKTPEQILEEYENTNDERKFRRKYAMLIKAFISANLGYYATGSITTRITAIKSFFRYNDLPLAHIPMARRRVTYHNRDITKEEINNIVDISTPRHRAMYTVLAQSGLRPHTLCELRYKHILPDFEEGTIPCKIEVPQEIAKGKYYAYFTFMGEDSVEFLKAYFKQRGKIKSDDYVFTKYESNRKASKAAISITFARTIMKLKKTGQMNFERKSISNSPNARMHSEVRLYNLRKWFRKQAGQAGQDFVNFWMGHSLGVDEHYFSRDVEHHRKVYAEKALPYLRLGKFILNETGKKVAEQAKMIQDLQTQIVKLQKTSKQWEKFFNISVGHRYHDVEAVEEKADRVEEIMQRDIDELTLDNQELKKKVEDLSKLVQDRIKTKEERNL